MNGDIDLVEWIESQEEVLVSVVMRQQLGHSIVEQACLDLLQGLQERGLLGGAVGLLVKAGNLEMPRWLAYQGHDVFAEAVHIAVINGHLSVAKFLRDQSPKAALR
jgi:hypothetical protein